MHVYRCCNISQLIVCQFGTSCTYSFCSMCTIDCLLLGNLILVAHGLLVTVMLWKTVEPHRITLNCSTIWICGLIWSMFTNWIIPTEPAWSRALVYTGCNLQYHRLVILQCTMNYASQPCTRVSECTLILHSNTDVHPRWLVSRGSPHCLVQCYDNRSLSVAWERVASFPNSAETVLILVQVCLLLCLVSKLKP